MGLFNFSWHNKRRSKFSSFDSLKKFPTKMAKSKNHTAHNQTRKNHRNPTRKPSTKLKHKLKGTDGKSADGKGTEEQEQDGKGTDGKSADGKGTKTEEQGQDGKGTEEQGQD